MLFTYIFSLFSSHISFEADNTHNMLMQSAVQVITKKLYNDDAERTPIMHGVLDRRMVLKNDNSCFYIFVLRETIYKIYCFYLQGVCANGIECATCGKTVHDCVGHFGYIDLVRPVFHVGHFKSIIQILQMICKVIILSNYLLRFITQLLIILINFITFVELCSCSINS